MRANLLTPKAPPPSPLTHTHTHAHTQAHRPPHTFLRSRSTCPPSEHQTFTAAPAADAFCATCRCRCDRTRQLKPRLHCRRVVGVLCLAVLRQALGSIALLPPSPPPPSPPPPPPLRSPPPPTPPLPAHHRLVRLLRRHQALHRHLLLLPRHPLHQPPPLLSTDAHVQAGTVVPLIARGQRADLTDFATAASLNYMDKALGIWRSTCAAVVVLNLIFPTGYTSWAWARRPPRRRLWHPRRVGAVAAAQHRPGRTRLCHLKGIT